MSIVRTDHLLRDWRNADPYVRSRKNLQGTQSITITADRLGACRIVMHPGGF